MKYIALHRLSTFPCQQMYFSLVSTCGRHRKTQKSSVWDLMDVETEETSQGSLKLLLMMPALQNGGWTITG